MAKESTNKNYLPPFITQGPIYFDPAETEHPLFRYDDRCTGIIAIYTSRKLNTDYIGNVTLDGAKIHHCFFLHPVDANMPDDQDILCIPVRGRIGYNSSHTLVLSTFRDADGNITEDMTIHVRGVNYANFQKDPRTTHEDNVALNAARESFVLLKNYESVLPMPPKETLNIFGSGYANFRTHSFHNEVIGRSTPTLEEAIKKSSFQLNEELDRFFHIPSDRTPDRMIFNHARNLSEYGIMIISRPSLRGRDVRPIPGEYYLTQEEDALLRMICHIFPKTIVILNTAYPIHLEWMKKYDVKALLYVGLPGQAGPEALLDVLSGKVCPSGKLTDTWCYNFDDYPASANFYRGDPIHPEDDTWIETCYEEGIYTGYRYFSTFTNKEGCVAYPFGFGLSYTAFTISPIFFNPINRVLLVNVKNVGKVAGKETVEVYATFPGTIQSHPTKQLIAFQKTNEILPGESEEVAIHIPLRNLSTFVSAQNAWFLESGTYQFFVGNSIQNLLPAGDLTNEEPRLLKQLVYHLKPSRSYRVLNPGTNETISGDHTRILSEDTAFKVKIHLQRENLLMANMVTASRPEIKDHKIQWEDVLKTPTLISSFVEQMTEEELMDFLIAMKPQETLTKRNHVLSLPENKRLGIPSFKLCPGNNGITNNFPTVCMPSSLNLAQTFNRSLMEEVGYCIGLEAYRADIHMLEDTSLNVHRIPLSGSNVDSFSEDPYVTGIMLMYKIRGLHRANIKSCIGHVLCANSETCLGSRIVLSDERTIRELYLRPYDILLREEKPDAILASNTILNHHMCGSYRILLEGVLRKELGFNGFVLTGTNDVSIQGVNSLMAGVSTVITDNDKQYRLLKSEIETAIRAGSLSIQILRILVKRMLLSLK